VANEKTKPKSTLQVFECKSVPVPPGTKSRGRLPHQGDPEPTFIGAYWPIGVITLAALVIGILVGRFLLV
jgi:hypothetical protein